VNLPYRAGVGVMLANGAGHIFVGQRFDSRVEAWQMPQGGIDEGEDPWTAALRELEEETGIAPRLVERLAESRDWLAYDLPPELMGRIWGGRYRGQRQKWYACRFLGTDADVNIDTRHPEFRAWAWKPLVELPRLIVPFKRQLYTALLDEFAPLFAASPAQAGLRTGS
jgi:putative (di)nucleoside polyphosphate hydrolase